MKVKIFTPDSNGRISFTKKELQALLDEVYKDGYEDARPYHWYWYPSYLTTATNTTNPQITWTADHTSTNTITASNFDSNNSITIPKPEDYKVEFK